MTSSSTLARLGEQSRCQLCDHVAVPDVDVGPLHEHVSSSCKTCCHLFCLLFSSGLDQRGSDEEGICGFLIDDIHKEMRRGKRLTCCVCGHKKATIGCAIPKCPKSFHLPCLLKSQGLARFTDTHPVFCLSHRPHQKFTQPPSKESRCGICFEELDSDTLRSLYTPCCRSWLHRSCVWTLASASGVCLKCPLCNIKEEFVDEMKLFGIHVPEREATWETDYEHHFADLNSRPVQCNMQDCLCSKGRFWDEEETQWELILCRSCGSFSTHLACSQLPLHADYSDWDCNLCSKALKRVPPRLVNVYHPVVIGGRSQERQTLSEITFKVSQDGKVEAFVDNFGLRIEK